MITENNNAFIHIFAKSTYAGIKFDHQEGRQAQLVLKAVIQGAKNKID